MTRKHLRPVYLLMSAIAKFNRSIGLGAIIALTMLLPDASALAQGLGDLVVAPTRLVFEGRTRSSFISLLNNGTQPGIFRITVVNMRMTETGQFERLEKDTEKLPGEEFAEGMFRYAPRQVELAPGQSQAIRLILRKPKDLAAGEYRSHLLIQRLPKEGTAGRSIEATASDGITINLVVVPGVALPVIVRHGELSSAATISSLSVTELPAGRKGISFRISRSGNRSVFGDLTATYFAPGKKDGIVVSRANKLAVYVPNASRNVVMGLTLPAGTKLASGGKIEVTYQLPAQEGGKMIAAATHDIP